MENVVELIPAVGENHHGHFLSSDEHSDVALNHPATGPEVLQEHGLSGLPGTNDLIVRADKTGIESAQAALDGVLDAKRFWH